MDNLIFVRINLCLYGFELGRRLLPKFGESFSEKLNSLVSDKGLFLAIFLEMFLFSLKMSFPRLSSYLML